MKSHIIQVILILSVGLVFSPTSVGQFSIGTWRDHLPYGTCVDLCAVDNYVYCATPYSMFRYNTADGDMFRISKVNFLSDVGISALEYDPYSKLIVVGYENGNVDLVAEGSGFNIPDIKFSSIIGDKKIYDIFPYGNKIYLSTGFGIVVIDTDKKEIKETYFIGNNGGPVRVNDLSIYGNKIYACTVNGIITADLSNPFLANFQNWTSYTDLPEASVPTQLEFFVDHMVLSVPGTNSDKVWRRPMQGGGWATIVDQENIRINKLWSNVEWLTVSSNFSYQLFHFDFGQNYNIMVHAGQSVEANMALVRANMDLWAADQRLGLLQYKFNNEQSVIKPQGPTTADCRRIGAYNNNVWIAHGGITPDWSNQWKTKDISAFVNDEWLRMSADNSNIENNNGIAALSDVMQIVVDPIDNNRIAIASWEEGIVMANINSLTGVATNGDNIKGPKQGSAQEAGWRGVAGINYTPEGILWCSNSWTTESLHAMDRSGNWYDFNFAPIITNTDKVGDVLVGSNGYVYTYVSGKGLLVLNTNGTLGNLSDDLYKILTDQEGEGGLPSRDVLCIEEDLDAEIWVGTAQGLAIYYSPDAIFSEGNFDAEQILIQQDGNTQILLETESINSIKIDGSNRKWIATENSGVYLFSDDGLNEIYHFTEDNSPLLSNTVYNIAINQSNGEIFFATEKGVIGFFSTATNFDPEMSNVRVFPNPVRPEYNGNIIIDGLAYNTSVKVTDIEGNIVFETESEGGRAVWNGLDFINERPKSGVYLVFVSTPDGSADEVRKLTFIK